MKIMKKSCFIIADLKDKLVLKRTQSGMKILCLYDHTLRGIICMLKSYFDLQYYRNYTTITILLKTNLLYTFFYSNFLGIPNCFLFISGFLHPTLFSRISDILYITHYIKNIII